MGVGLFAWSLGASALLVGCTLLVNQGDLSGGPEESRPDANATGADVSTPQTDAGAGSDAAEDAGLEIVNIPGLIGYWKLDDGSGLLAHDYSPRANHGALLGSPTWTTDQTSSSAALMFDGVDDAVLMTGTAPYATKNAPFSVSAWFYLTDFGNGYPDILQLRSDGNTPWHILLCNRTEYLGISLGAGDGWTPIKTQQIPALDTWHHLVVTYSGADPMVIESFTITLDGNAQALVAANGYGSQSQETRIGASSDANRSNQFKGLIREVRIYDRLLSDSERNDLSKGM